MSIYYMYIFSRNFRFTEITQRTVSGCDLAAGASTASVAGVSVCTRLYICTCTRLYICICMVQQTVKHCYLAAGA